jgi:hypothetical protein
LLKELLGVGRQSALWHPRWATTEVTVFFNWSVKHRPIVMRVAIRFQNPLIHTRRLEW